MVNVADNVEIFYAHSLMVILALQNFAFLCLWSVNQIYAVQILTVIWGLNHILTSIFNRNCNALTRKFGFKLREKIWRTKFYWQIDYKLTSTICKLTSTFGCIFPSTCNQNYRGIFWFFYINIYIYILKSGEIKSKYMNTPDQILIYMRKYEQLVRKKQIFLCRIWPDLALYSQK